MQPSDLDTGSIQFAILESGFFRYRSTKQAWTQARILRLKFRDLFVPRDQYPYLYLKKAEFKCRNVPFSYSALTQQTIVKLAVIFASLPNLLEKQFYLLCQMSCLGETEWTQIFTPTCHSLGDHQSPTNRATQERSITHIAFRKSNLHRLKYFTQVQPPVFQPGPKACWKSGFTH